MTKVSAIMTGHREGLLAGPSIASFREAINEARARKIDVETLVVLDRPDATTLSMFENVGEWCDRLVQTDYGDPGLSRNRGVAEAKGSHITFLDADDLWSFNWIFAAHDFQKEAGEQAILHSEMNVIFGGARQIWIHADSESPNFDPGYLQIGNYWDALVFAPRATYLAYPFEKNDLNSGYGHEDWHLNCVTLVDGYSHRPVPHTVHFKRRRGGSQSAAANDKDVIPWPTSINDFNWIDARLSESEKPAGVVRPVDGQSVAAANRRSAK